MLIPCTIGSNEGCLSEKEFLMLYCKIHKSFSCTTNRYRSLLVYANYAACM